MPAEGYERREDGRESSRFPEGRRKWPEMPENEKSRRVGHAGFRSLHVGAAEACDDGELRGTAFGQAFDEADLKVRRL